MLPSTRFALAAATFTFLALAAPAAAAPLRILPLGDSITWGVDDGAGDGSYRAFLYKLAVKDGLAIDFVGALRNGPADLPDKEHQGMIGWTIRKIADPAFLDPKLASYKPDVVILMIGTNDAQFNDDLPMAPDRLSALIDRLVAGAPERVVIVGSAPTPRKDGRVTRFNAAIPAVVEAKVKDGKRVAYVDAYNVVADADVAKYVHLTARGHEKLAAAFYAALLAQVGPAVSVDGGAGDAGAPPQDGRSANDAQVPRDAGVDAERSAPDAREPATDARAAAADALAPDARAPAAEDAAAPPTMDADPPKSAPAGGCAVVAFGDAAPPLPMIFAVIALAAWKFRRGR